MSSSIKVAVRIRPFPQNELEMPESNNKNIFHVLQGNQLVIKPLMGCGSTNEIKSFTFDYVFDDCSDQSQVFEAVKPLVENFLKGFTSSVLAYGQTGSGKTYSMGISKELLSYDSSEIGIVPRAIKYIFEHLNAKKNEQQVEYEITASFLELYNEELVDLLDKPIKSFLPRPKPLIREENGITFVSNIIEEKCNDPKSVLQVLNRGSQSRMTASTDMNDVSSRSHAIFTVTLKRKEMSGIGGVLTTTSKFHFVDLAGSERLKKTGSDGDRKKEGISINQGLLALGNVISALGDESKKSTHIPYRDSKLTRLLQESLGGNSQTLMISCVSPIQNNYSESLATLTYANRTRNIKNKITINQEWNAGASQHKEIKNLQEIIAKLQEETLMIRNDLESVTTSKNALEVQLKEEEEKSKLLNQDLMRTSTEKNEAVKLAELFSKKVQECEFTLATQSDSFVEMARSVEEHKRIIKDLEEKLLSTTRLQQVQLKRLEELSSEKAQIWMEKSSLNTKISGLQKNYDLMLNDMKNKDDLLANLNTDIETLKKQKEHLKDATVKWSSKQKILQDSFSDDLASQLIQTIMWNTKYDFAMDNISLLEAEREDLLGMVSSLKMKNDEFDLINISNNSKIYHLTNELESKNRALKETENIVKMQRDEFENELSLKNQSLQNLENLSRLQKAEFEKTIERLHNELASQGRSLDLMQARYSDQINELSETKERLDTSIAERDVLLERLQSDLILSNENCDHLKLKLAQVADEMSKVEAALSNERCLFQSDKSVFEEKMKNEKQEKDIINNENDHLRGRVEELEKEVSSLKNIQSKKVSNENATEKVSNENATNLSDHRKKRKSNAKIDDMLLNNPSNNENDHSENPMKKVNIRKKKNENEKLGSFSVAKKSGGVLSSIAVLMSNPSRQNSPKGIRTRARTKAKELNINVEQLKPKMPLKYVKQLVDDPSDT